MTIRHWLFTINHQLWDLSRLLGIRNRLRCPHCHAIGTWKPHGGWIDVALGDLASRRWLCKWCGFYQSTSRTCMCFPSNMFSAWSLPEATDLSKTPQQLSYPWFPWRG